MLRHPSKICSHSSVKIGVTNKCLNHNSSKLTKRLKQGSLTMVILQAKLQNLTWSAKVQQFGHLFYILPTSRVMHQHVSTHLQECGEEGREDEKKQLFCSSSYVEESRSLTATSLNRSPALGVRGTKAQLWAGGKAPGWGDISCQNSSTSQLVYGLTKNLGVGSTEIHINTNNVQEQRPSPKLG